MKTLLKIVGGLLVLVLVVGGGTFGWASMKAASMPTEARCPATCSGVRDALFVTKTTRTPRDRSPSTAADAPGIGRFPR